MDYRNLAEEELKLRIAEQFFPTYDCAHRIGKIDFTGAKGAQPVRATSGAKGARPMRGPKGGRPVRATSGQWEDHTSGTLRPYENHSVEKGYRVGAAVLRGRRCGRRAHKR